MKTIRGNNLVPFHTVVNVLLVALQSNLLVVYMVKGPHQHITILERDNTYNRTLSNTFRFVEMMLLPACMARAKRSLR